MNIDDLADVEYEDDEGLQRFLFENYLEHLLFRDVIESATGTIIPAYPIADLDPVNVDTWLLDHYQEHQSIAKILDLDISVNLLDTDWRKEESFYDWLNLHYLMHNQIIKTLGLT